MILTSGSDIRYNDSTHFDFLGDGIHRVAVVVSLNGVQL